jgi:hypothetical protein
LQVIHIRTPDVTPALRPKPHVSLFTRLAAVEAELKGLKDLVARLKADHEAMRKDRGEWRWRRAPAGGSGAGLLGADEQPR